MVVASSAAAVVTIIGGGGVSSCMLKSLYKYKVRAFLVSVIDEENAVYQTIKDDQ
jgi:tRNA A37 threonylcarbamoyladenosine dehydratase